MTTLTLKLLKQLDACKESFAFVENNNLVGMPLSMLDDIKGDHEGYVCWIKEKLEAVKEFDDNGNCLHYMAPNGFEWQKEYDENGNCLHYRDSRGPSGFEWWREYDDNGNCLHHRDSSGYEWWRDFSYWPTGQLKSVTKNDEIVLEIPMMEIEE